MLHSPPRLSPDFSTAEIAPRLARDMPCFDDTDLVPPVDTDGARSWDTFGGCRPR